ncbi:NAD+--asparagine ADP-ribosyltransferase [Clostridium acetobutylicum]|uniref:LXG domain-containing protein n=1 Tax=Clostridium acetobutylicum (strain ATCC 824 / DSM 792 / JCM 1419 / IAM 19013 / LMG 5710 / NBRC 13948 / NRRL B-527 / VKM B-1787 / 2291 / W) TaxID=272562 RepID=Q97M65_CLOAB|nr:MULTISPECIES: AHH domain-containing protein [Clostridium]AAK78314.1 Hypothetical protein, CF-7 family [Clostridium acetobutylicum ATCC 824]ADZ19383.1 conserved hypothetical protein [Clostridium acetobutylicum EA 2018]AEI31174.1 hypothetical protein SMB_G0341 [Clostridium acetobutylicum DSM 1731]AWV80039.1 hypothetical protein DK921_08020 [Clostridium acetobutylicum]MBC2395859.1 hypothetical protein [Clostridium acetobutylicum]
MSNSELYYEELTDLSVRIALGIKNRTEPLDELNQAMTQLSQTNAIKGNAANAMKAYISEVHMTLIQTLELILNNYEMALGKYVKGYLEVDSDESFKLIKEDFDAHKHNLSSHQSDFTSIGNKLKAISDEAEDIIPLRGAGSKRLFNVAKDMGTMKEIVSNLNNKWNDYEQADPGFNQVQDLIAQTTSLLKSTLSVPRGYSYSPGSFSKLISKDFVNAFEVNANYAQNADNQKAFKANWDRISKNYTTDQNRMAEEAKKEAQKEGLIGLIWDELQIAGGTVITVIGLGLTPFTGGLSIGLVVLGGSMVVGGVNSAINHTSMAITGKGYNLVGNLTNGALQWYNKNIGEPLVKTGNPIAKFVAGFGSGAIELAGGMGQFSVYDTGKTVHTLWTNPQARAQVGKSIGNWWNQIRSGNAYVIGQTAAVAASVLVAPEDIGAAAGDASKAESLLGKVGTFSKSIAVSSVENAKNIATLPWRTVDNLGSKVADLRTVLNEGKGAIGDLTKSVVVSSAKNAKSVLTKVKGTVSDFGTASAEFAKAFGKTYVEESGKYANTCFSATGAAGAGAKAAYKATIAGAKEAKSAFRVGKAGENGFGDMAAESKRLIPGTPGVVTGGSSTKLGKNMFEEMGLPRSTKRTPYQAQHIIPKDFKEHPIIQKIGMDMDHASNGYFLRRPDESISPMSRHEGYHAVYSDFVERQLNAMDINQSINILEKQVYDLQQKLRKLQDKGLPLYMKDDYLEKELSKIKKKGFDAYKQDRVINKNKVKPIWDRGGGATIELWERWFNKL